MPYFHWVTTKAQEMMSFLRSFVCFLNEIHPFLIQALNYSFQHGELSISQRQAVITLIEKKERTKDALKIGDQFRL